jgi:hypothetical protein
LCKFEDFNVELKNTAESHSTVFIDSDDLIESFDDIWEYFRPLGQALKKEEREEAHEAFVALCKDNVMAIEDDDNRWYRVKREQIDLRTVLPIRIFRDWFLNYIADISPVIQRRIHSDTFDDHASEVMMTMTESSNDSFCNQYSAPAPRLLDDDVSDDAQLPDELDSYQSQTLHKYAAPAPILDDEEIISETRVRVTEQSTNLIIRVTG